VEALGLLGRQKVEVGAAEYSRAGTPDHIAEGLVDEHEAVLPVLDENRIGRRVDDALQKPTRIERVAARALDSGGGRLFQNRAGHQEKPRAPPAAIARLRQFQRHPDRRAVLTRLHHLAPPDSPGRRRLPRPAPCLRVEPQGAEGLAKETPHHLGVLVAVEPGGGRVPVDDALLAVGDDDRVAHALQSLVPSHLGGARPAARDGLLARDMQTPGAHAAQPIVRNPGRKRGRRLALPGLFGHDHDGKTGGAGTNRRQQLRQAAGGRQARDEDVKGLSL